MRQAQWLDPRCLSSIILSPLNGNVKLSPYEQGDICIFEGQSYDTCHGDSGVGTAAAAASLNIGAKVSLEQLAEMFKHPTAKMTAGGMPPNELPPGD
jgi:hypothetical protein